MQIKRFLGNLAKTYLALGALSVSALAGANEFYPAPYAGPAGNGCGWDCPPVCHDDCNPCCNTPCHPAPRCNWGYNPPGYFSCGTDSCCFSDSLGLNVDFLWWRAKTDGTDLGYTEVFTTSTSGLEILDRVHKKQPHFRFDPGVRVGIDYHCPCDCWDVALVWTDYHTRAIAHGESEFPLTGPSEIFTPFFEAVSGVPAPDEAEGRWHLSLDLLDLEFGSKYYVSSCLILRPHFGLRGVRLNQNFTYEGYANRTISEVLTAFDSYAKFKDHFLGAGPRVGLDIELSLGCNFWLFGKAAGTLAYGRFERSIREEHTALGETDVITRFSESIPSDRSSIAIGDLTFGLLWEQCVCWCNRSHPFGLALSWEHHGFYDVTDFTFARTQSDKHDLYIQGLTVSANFGF